jgi:hypothetical protein
MARSLRRDRLLFRRARADLGSDGPAAGHESIDQSDPTNAATPAIKARMISNPGAVVGWHAGGAGRRAPAPPTGNRAQSVGVQRCRPSSSEHPPPPEGPTTCLQVAKTTRLAVRPRPGGLSAQVG